MKEEPQKNAPENGKEESRNSSAQKSGMGVFLYIVLLVSAALLLMGLSSMIHQRNNTEVLGKLQSSVSDLQRVQNFQEKVIELQDTCRTLEEQLNQARSDQSSAASLAEESRRRLEAMERLYLIEAQYAEGFYQSCQTSVDAFEADGLPQELPSAAPAEGVLSPLDRYRQIREAVAARLAEILNAPPMEEDAD